MRETFMGESGSLRGFGLGHNGVSFGGILVGDCRKPEYPLALTAQSMRRSGIMEEVSTSEGVQSVNRILARARAEVAKVIIGQERVVDQCLIAIFTGNHILIEGVPGVAKTLLVRTLAKVLGTEFSRIQFTPDLMPSDITGTNVFSLQESSFHLVRGPVFTSFLLADEINRAPAKTQSALLQAMQERLVTIDGVTHELPASFTVFATQNPIEYEGTYPLPEAQKDRFLLRVEMGYPGPEAELQLAMQSLGRETPEYILAGDTVERVLTEPQIQEVQVALRSVTMKEELVAYVVEIVRRSRDLDSIQVGAGPRATQALLLSSRALAAIEGRDYVTPDDVRAMAHPVLAHRIVLRPEYEIEGVTVGEAILKLLDAVAVPR
ncbi:MAG TPA: MoxR family ATPase [Verrucomicrobiales bacterium]|nr:MoxR family ATPase [Verrucomicrobiales bacterium]